MSQHVQAVVGKCASGWHLALSDQGRKASYRYKWVLNLACGHTMDFFSEPRLNRDSASPPPTVIACLQCRRQAEQQQELEADEP